MSKTLWLRVSVVVFIFLWGFIYILPNFMDVSKIKFFSGKKVTYGLDIQGGIHLVMGVDVQGVIGEHAKRFLSSMIEDYKEKNAVAKDSHITNNKNGIEVSIDFENADQAKQVAETVSKDYREFLLDSQNGSNIKLRYNEAELREFKKKTLEQAIETLRNRIDEFGVAEPSITAQGDDRILVQLPGIEDASHAKELINKTARLEFTLVDSTIPTAEVNNWVAEVEKKGNYSLVSMKYNDYVKRINGDLKSKLPKDRKILFEKSDGAETMAAGKTAYLVGATADLTGDDLKNAQVTFSQYNTPEVAMSFNPAGATKFANVTEKNVNHQLAIVLDDVIYAAPNIKGRIGGGNAVIELGNRNYEQTMNEAKIISMALRAGALPAKLEQLEERTVGPSLGLDSIAKAKEATIVATILIFAIMLIAYKGFGILASFALIFNGILILAFLSALGATLTLPGVAGIALTMGMAVDANVIINERIKEELRRGVDLETAIRFGYERAMSAIIDSNLTGVLTAALLIYFGTGPVRGFGATLIIGVVSSMFTAIFCTKAFADLLTQKFKIKIAI